MKTNRWCDPWLTALAPLIWGSTYLLTSELLPPNVPLLSAAIRTLPVGLLMLCYLRLLPKGDWWWKALVLGLLNIGVFQALLFVAAYRLPGGVAATVGAIQPLVVVMLSVLVLRQPSRWTSWLAALGGLSGIALLVLGPTASFDPLGLLAAAAGAMAMATGTILTKKWQPKVSAMVLTSWQLTAGGLVLLPLALCFEQLPPMLTASQILAYVWLGLVGTGLTYILWLRGVLRLSATAVSSISLLSPVSATLLGLLVLQQTLDLTQSIGMALVLGSVLIGQLRSQAMPVKPAMEPALTSIVVKSS